MASSKRATAPTALDAEVAQRLVARARQAWLEGCFDETLTTSAQVLDSHAPREALLEAIFLRARLRLRQYDEAGAEAELERLPALTDPDERATRDMLLGTALRRRKSPAAWEHLRSAVAQAKHVGVRAEAALFLAQALWAERRLGEAEEILDRTVDGTTDIIYARGIELYGWIEDSRGRYTIAIRHFLEALSALDNSQNDDAYMRAGLLQILSSSAVTSLDLRLGRTVRKAAERLGDGDGYASRRFYLMQNLGYLDLLEGNVESAWRHFEDNLIATTRSDRRAIAHTDLAFATAQAGDVFAPRRHLDAAFALLIANDWTTSDPDDRNALLDFAIVAAPVDRRAAREALSRYEGLTARPNDAMALEGDRRVAALHKEARGTIDAVEASRSAGPQLLDAQRTWHVLGYRLYEARAALTRYHCTRARDAWETVNSISSLVPTSWLRRDIEKKAGMTSKADALTPAERRVMVAICEGKSAAAIAVGHSRSINTIRNQTRKVFKTMGVRSRAQLVAECARLGLLSPARLTDGSQGCRP